MKRNRRLRRVKVTADGEGLVSRAGVALLRELTVDTGLAAGWTTALLDTYKAIPTVHAPGRVLADLAVVIADGGDALAHLATLRTRTSCSARSPPIPPRGAASSGSTRRIWSGCGRSVRPRESGRGPPAQDRTWPAGW